MTSKSEFTSEILPENFLTKYKNQQPNWGFNGLGYIVYKRTYSRFCKNGQKEEWWQTIARCINGAQKIGAGYTKEEAQLLYDKIFNLKCSYPGRMLWALGTDTIDRFGANAAVNCWFVAINSIKSFLFLFENLMLGGGVGFSVRREDVYQLPKIKKDVNIIVKNSSDADFIVPDSREGWIKLLKEILTSFFETGKSFSYSTILVRKAGAPIKGFGGTASGPEVLEKGMKTICDILKSRENKRLRSIDALDICNLIASVVVAGNTRRSAEIALGDPDDILFLRAKRWDLGNIPPWRSNSNNTIYADDYDHIMENVWDGYGGNGEAYGFFNLRLCQTRGRLGEKNNDDVIGVNPCGEVPLQNLECCNLSELFLNNIESKSELITCAKLLYKTQKAVAAFHYIHEETNEVVHKNMRLGLGITGICQSLDKIVWLDECYKELKKFDKIWSKERGWNESIKLTTTKPSGTVSLLAGATPGIHPGYAPYYIRTVRISANDPLVDYCKSVGYPIEPSRRLDKSIDESTMVISFPCESDSKTIVAKDMSAIRQLELLKTIQKEWSDNAVSTTVYYHPEELKDIKAWLAKHYKNNIKSVSFLLHKNHGFDQAPYQEITKEEYDRLISNLNKKSEIKIESSELLDGIECVGGACPVR